MYSVLLTFQIAAIIFSFVCVGVILLQKSSNLSKLMLMACLCSFIQNVGYLLEMQSKNLSDAMTAVKIEYVGGSFIMTMLMIFTFRYCHFKINNIIKYSLLIIDTIVLISVWCWEYIHLYYKSASFVDTGVLPHVVLEKGFLYIIFSILIYIQFLACAVVTMLSVVRSNDTNMRKNYLLLFFSCTVPCLFYIAGIFGFIEGYDSAPIGGCVGIVIFGVAIVFRRVFDVVETAHENILMDLSEAIVILDYKRGFQEANKAAKNIFPELNDLSHGQLVPSETFNSLLDNNSDEEIEINGRYYKSRVDEIRARGGQDSGLIGYDVVLFDVTESKKQIEKMNELRVAADSANKAKSSFLANVSHEIRTPINVVVGMSDVILRDYEDTQLLGYANNIQTAANTLLDLINDILDFSKIESGKVTLQNDDYRVDDFFRDIVMVFRHKSTETGLEFKTEIAPSTPRVLYGDSMRLRQIITNILTNAFKYTREGSVTLKSTFERLDDNKGNLIVAVEDTGIGIKQEEIDQLFEVFVRLDERLNKSVEGTGLGLNITKNLIDLMDGDIKIYSEYGKGSIFTIIIPQVIKSGVNETIGELDCKEVITTRKGVGYVAPDARVLVVDDSKTNLIVAKALLRDTRVKVTTAASGTDCIELVKKEHFDVIFLDHRMPIMDGVETLHKMQSIDHMCKGVPVIMLTANAVSNAKDFYISEGFSDFITKPICEESITSMLENYLPKELIQKV